MESVTTTTPQADERVRPRQELEAELAAANAKLEYVASLGLQLGMASSSDRPEPYLMHVWAEDSTQARIFREWSHSFGWEEREAKLKAGLAEARNDIVMLNERLAERHRDMMARIVSLRAELAKAKATILSPKP